MPGFELEKELAAIRSLDFIEDGMSVGLGTGSTASYFIRELGNRVRAGLRIKGIPTSARSKALAAREGIPLTDFDELSRLDITVDGADEVDPRFNLIKGGGGALLREKIVASVTARLIIVADSRKLVARLGRFPLPVEVVPFGWQITAAGIRKLGAGVDLRMQSSDQPFVTTEGNYILDCRFGELLEAERLAERLKGMVGVVEHGLFVGLVDSVIVGRGNTTEILRRS